MGKNGDMKLPIFTARLLPPFKLRLPMPTQLALARAGVEIRFGVASMNNNPAVGGLQLYTTRVGGRSGSAPAGYISAALALAGV